MAYHNDYNNFHYAKFFSYFSKDQVGKNACKQYNPIPYKEPPQMDISEFYYLNDKDVAPAVLTVIFNQIYPNYMSRLSHLARIEWMLISKHLQIPKGVALMIAFYI